VNSGGKNGVKVVAQGPIEQLPLPYELPSNWNWPSPTPSLPCRREANNKNPNCGKKFIHEMPENERIRIRVPVGTTVYQVNNLGERQ
jgi:hypothetical protein